MWKWTSAILLFLLIGSNGWWLYQAIDLAATEKYRQQEQYEADRVITALKAITTEYVRGASKEELFRVLGSVLPDDEPFEKDGEIHVDFLSFPISDDDSIAGVR